MKKLRISATITTILGALSVMAIFLLILALSDIARQAEDLKLEWYLAGICLIIFSAFTISTFVTIGFLLKSLRFTDSIPVIPKMENV